MYRLNNNKTYTRIYTNTHKRPSIARTFEAPHAFFPNHDPFSFPIKLPLPWIFLWIFTI